MQECKNIQQLQRNSLELQSLSATKQDDYYILLLLQQVKQLARGRCRCDRPPVCRAQGPDEGGETLPCGCAATSSVKQTNKYIIK